MMIHVDVLIINSFIILSLILGLSSGWNIGILQANAAQDKNATINTQAIIILGAMMGGGFLFYHVECIYKDGLYYILPFFLSSLFTLGISRLIAPRMKEFLHHHSIAESMGVLFGNKVRVITALFGIWFSMGIIVLQFIVVSKMIHIYLQLDSQYFIYEVLGVMFFYMLIKHIKATSFTNCISLVFFSPLLPIMLCLIKVLIHMPMKSGVVSTLLTHENFDIKQIIGWHPKFWQMLNLCVLSIIPEMNPAVMQRVYSASNVWQVRKIFNYVTLLSLIMVSLGSLLAIWLRAWNLHLDPQDMVAYLISIQSYPLVKEFLCICVFVFTMRMVDVYFSTVSVLFTHDIVPFLKILDSKNKLAANRVCIIVIGIIGFGLKLYQRNCLDFTASIVFVQCIYFVIGIPFLMALFGFRPRSQSILLGMGAGSITILLWKICVLENYLGRGSEIIGVFFVEMLVIISSHYWLLRGAHSGWVGIKEKLPLLLDQQEQRETRRKLVFCATESSLFSSKKIFSLYGIYILCIHGISWYFIDSPSYYEICYHIGALLWGGGMIGYAWYHVPSKTMTPWMFFFWLGGLFIFLFIIGPLHCIINKYDCIWCIILCANFIMAYILWPLSFVISMTLGGFLFTGACICYNIIEWSEFAWQEDCTTVILLCTTITIVSLLYIKTQKIIVHQKMKCKYIKELQLAQDACKLHTLQFRQRIHCLLTQGHNARVDDLLPNMRLFFKLYNRIKSKEERKKYLCKLRQIYEIPHFLQERYYYDQEFLPLTIESISLSAFMREIKTISKELGYNNELLFNTLRNVTLYGDKKQLRQLLVASVEYLETKDTKWHIIKLGMIRTTLQYELKVACEESAIKTIPALAIYLTTDHVQEPNIASHYQGNFEKSNSFVFRNITNLTQWENECIIDAHYGCVTTIENERGYTLVYVIPLDLRQIRSEVMDKVSYNSVGPYETEYSNALGVTLQESIQKNKIFDHMAIIDLEEVLFFIKKCYGHATRRYIKEPLYTFVMSMTLELVNITKKPNLILSALLYGVIEVANLPLSYIRCKYGYKVAYLLSRLSNFTQDYKKVAYKSSSHYIPIDMDRDDDDIGTLKLVKRVIQLRSEIAYEVEEMKKVLIRETLLCYVPFAKKINCLALSYEMEQICISLESDFLEGVLERNQSHFSVPLVYNN